MVLLVVPLVIDMNIYTYIHTSDGSSFCILYYLYGHIKCLKAHDIPGMVTKYTFNTSDSF